MAMAHDRLCFGDFELSLRAYELRRLGTAISLQRIPMELLLLFAQRPGELVTRAEIAEALWGSEADIDVEASVNTAVRKLRQALQDDPAQPAYLATVTGKGYRFIANVLGGNETAPRLRRRIALAVMPFENLGADPEDQYLADGVTDETISAVGKVAPDQLAVIARTSSMAYRNAQKDAATIGRELGVDYLLEGTLRKDGARRRLTARLVRVVDHLQVWSETFDRDVHKFMGLHGEIGRAIAGQIHVHLSPEQKPPSPATVSPDAYDHYLRGQFYWWQLTPDSGRRAAQCFEQAIAADPEYALAYTGLARLHTNRPINSDARPIEEWALARAAAIRALEIDPNLGEGHASLGNMKFWFEWDWAGAASELSLAIDLQPNNALAYLYLAHVWSNGGHATRVAEPLEQALILDPLSSPMHAVAGQILFQARDYAGALERVRHALVLNQEFWIAHIVHAKVLAEIGRPDEALKACQRALIFSGGNTEALSMKGWVLATSGRRGEAREVLSALERTSESRFVPPYNIALVQAGLGETAAAFASLERGFDERDPHMVFLTVDPKWDALRGDERFDSLLRSCGMAKG
jgi:TolB-like protein/tetratricopeptide (TPR) repeat protein